MLIPKGLLPFGSNYVKSYVEVRLDVMCGVLFWRKKTIMIFTISREKNVSSQNKKDFWIHQKIKKERLLEWVLVNSIDKISDCWIRNLEFNSWGCHKLKLYKIK